MPRPRSERRSAWPAVVLALALLLPVLYVLSVGPAAWLAETDRINGTVFVVVYGPVIWATSQSDWVLERLNWYLAWWFEHLPPT